MKRFFWRLTAALILRDEHGWPWRSAWAYSAALHTYNSYFEEECSPRDAITEDRQYWE